MIIASGVASRAYETLEGVARSLEAQARKLEALERESAELCGKVATLEGQRARRGADESGA